MLWSSLPDVELSRQVGYETELFAQNDDARHQEVARQALRDRVMELVENWNAVQCAPRAQVTPFVGERR